MLSFSLKIETGKYQDAFDLPIIYQGTETKDSFSCYLMTWNIQSHPGKWNLIKTPVNTCLLLQSIYNTLPKSRNAINNSDRASINIWKRKSDSSCVARMISVLYSKYLPEPMQYIQENLCHCHQNLLVILQDLNPIVKEML